MLGNCAYEEMIRPGLSSVSLCARLLGLMRSWDDFIDRADAFGLSEETAARLWDAREHGEITSSALCPPVPSWVAAQKGAEQESEDSEAKSLLSCHYLWGGICLLALPRCGGACANYCSREDHPAGKP